MSLNWGARAPTSCHYLIYFSRLFTTHMTAVLQQLVKSFSTKHAFRACHHSHFIEKSGQAGEGGRLAAVKEQEPNRPDRKAPPGS